MSDEYIVEKIEATSTDVWEEGRLGVGPCGPWWAFSWELAGPWVFWVTDDPDDLRGEPKDGEHMEPVWSDFPHLGTDEQKKSEAERIIRSCIVHYRGRITWPTE